jgi:hypothetical protein
MAEQGGVIARRQVLAAGGDDNLIERMIRRNEWRPVHPGVYVNHTGTPTGEQLNMAAVQYAWPAALTGESALVAHGVRNIAATGVNVAIDATRRVRSRPAIEVTRLARFATQTHWQRLPPRIRLESAAVQVASRRWKTHGEAAAVALLSDICQQQRSTPARLLAAVEAHGRLDGRAFLRTVLDDVACGAYSVLERRYLTQVERPHGLPRAIRQGRFASPVRAGFRDVHYTSQQLVLELDGRLGHEWAADQWADLERDLVSVIDGQLTVRLGWGPVSSPCRLAVMIGQLLIARGWTGPVLRCPSC